MSLLEKCCSFSDLKLKDVNLVEAYKDLTDISLKMVANKCHGCIKLGEHLKLAAEIKKHKEEVNSLKFQMSDEALQQMPDFQGRVLIFFPGSIVFLEDN